MYWKLFLPTKDPPDGPSLFFKHSVPMITKGGGQIALVGHTKVNPTMTLPPSVVMGLKYVLRPLPGSGELGFREGRPCQRQDRRRQAVGSGSSGSGL